MPHTPHPVLPSVSQTDLQQELMDLREKMRESILQPEQSDAALTRETNQLKDALHTHQHHVLLTNLYTLILPLIRRHCEVLLPLTSGHYRPRATANTIFAAEEACKRLAHQTGSIPHTHHTTTHASPMGGLTLSEIVTHTLTHTGHIVLEILHAEHILKISAVWGHMIPLIGNFICVALKIAEIFHETHVEKNLIQQLALHYRTFSYFSVIQREAVYQFVLAKTLIDLASQIQSSPIPTLHPQAVPIENQLTSWTLILCGQIIWALQMLPEHMDNPQEFATFWSKATIKALGGKIPSSSTDLVVGKYVKTDLSLALDVQSIFTNPDPGLKNWITKRERTTFELPICRAIYSGFLEAYQHRVNCPRILSNLILYKDAQLNALEHAFSRFNHAIYEIETRLPTLKKSSFYDLQKSLIEACLLGNFMQLSAILEQNARAIGQRCHDTKALSIDLVIMQNIAPCAVPLRHETGDYLVIISAAHQEQRISARGDRITALETENQELRGKVNALQDKVESIQKTMGDMQNKMEGMHNDMEGLSANIAILTQAVTQTLAPKPKKPYQSTGLFSATTEKAQTKACCTIM